jgi:ribosome-binding factor A
MASRRVMRVAEILRNEIGSLIIRERLLEPYFITISSVDLTPDLKQAFVYYSTLKKANDEALEKEFQRLRPMWQKVLAKKVQLKNTPVLVFKFDDSLERGTGVVNLIDSLEIPPESPEDKKEE